MEYTRVNSVENDAEKESKRPGLSLVQRLHPRLMFKRGSDASLNPKQLAKAAAAAKEKEKLPIQRKRSCSVDQGLITMEALMKTGGYPMRTPPNSIETLYDDNDSLAPRKFVPPPGTQQHTASTSDTLASIAAQYHSTVSELRMINKLMSNMVFPGQVIYVPGEGYVATSYSSQSSSRVAGSDSSREGTRSPNGQLNEGEILELKVIYITPRHADVSGLLKVTHSEVTFEPEVASDEKEEIRHVLERYRMSLGKAVIAADIRDVKPTADKSVGTDNPSASSKKKSDSKPDTASHFGDLHPVPAQYVTIKETEEEELMNEDITASATKEAAAVNKNSSFILSADSEDVAKEQEEDEEMATKYLFIRLGVPREAGQAHPTIGSLIHISLPVNIDSWVEHCFAIPASHADDLQEALSICFPQIFKKSDDEDQLQKSVEQLRKRPKRMLSVAELYNLPLPEMSHPSSIINDTHIRTLREHLDARSDGRPWTLVYNSEKHGFSISTLYRRQSCFDESSTILIIQDIDDRVFGAALPCSVRICESFYGSGESFLFTFHPFFKKFSWSGKNSYLVKGNIDSLSIGASDGIFGLWLDDNLFHGRTQPCETFDNEELTDVADFTIKLVELWAFI